MDNIMTTKTKSIWVKTIPSDLPLKDKAKYTVACPKCVENRHKTGTKSLQIYRDDDGIVRWECYHPGCSWNIRQATKDSDVVQEELEPKLEFAVPMTVDPTKEGILQPLIKSAEMIHWYKNSDGKFLFGIRRVVKPDGAKIMTPIAMLANGDFTVAEYPQVKTLYNAEELAERPDAPVIVVEGEKAVDLGKHKVPNSVVVTWPGGCNGVERGDWTLLKGRQVLIWPDQDDSGKKAASEIAKKILGDVSIAYVNHLPESADLADEISQEDISKAIEARIEQSGAIEITHALTKEHLLDYLKTADKGLKTGWDIVDQSILLRGLSVIEGRSSHGKSTVMFNLANNVLQRGEPVVFYSYEMSADEVLLRLSLLNEKRSFDPIPWRNEAKLSQAILDGRSEGYKKIESYLNKSFFLTDENLNIERLVKELNQPSLRGATVFIDYIQFIPPSSTLGMRARYLQIKEFAEMLKNVAKRQHMTIITGAQLTAGERPAQDVAREGKDIYNAADVVLRIWNREEGNQTETKWCKNDNSEADGLLLVRKARAGATMRSFDFNFTDTRKMVFNVDQRLRLEGDFNDVADDFV